MTSDQVARPDEMVAGQAAEFALVLPPQMTPDYFTRLSVGLLRKSPALWSAAQRNPRSLLSALLECARLGLEPGDGAALVPFKDTKRGTTEIQVIPEWQGMVRRMFNSGRVRSVHAEAVFAGDRFSFQPADERPVHEVDWFGDRGALVGAYAYAVLDDGSVSKVAIVGPREAERAKAMSRGSNRPESPWNTDTAEMWRKTAVRRLADWVPSSSVDMVWQARMAAAEHTAAGSAVARSDAATMVLPAAPPSTAAAAAVTSTDTPVDTTSFVDEVTGEIHDESPPDTGQAGTDPTPPADVVDADVVDDTTSSSGEEVLR